MRVEYGELFNIERLLLEFLNAVEWATGDDDLWAFFEFLKEEASEE